MRIAKNTIASIEFTLSTEEGRLIDSSQGKQPLMYLHGSGSIIPGIERALEGKSAGDNVKLLLSPDDAYGQKDPDMVQPILRENFSGVDEIKVGMQFRAQTPAGARIVTVVGVDDANVTINANHPLAGLSLFFEATVLEVREPTEDELSHGHACQGQCGREDCQ